MASIRQGINQNIWGARLGRALLASILIVQVSILIVIVRRDHSSNAAHDAAGDQAGAIDDAKQVAEFRLMTGVQAECSDPKNPLNYILGTGQSLSNGYNSNPAIDTFNRDWNRF